MSDLKTQLLARLHNHEARIAIVGLGYVGLPLAVAFARRGFDVVGVDIDPDKVDAIRRGESYILDVSSESLAELVSPRTTNGSRHRPGRISATTRYAELAECDVTLICVPTPLNKTRDPDVRYLLAATES
ncbi:MAG: hypothetical protein D6791_14980, partial [Chloroflexi bacterium]